MYFWQYIIMNYYIWQYHFHNVVLYCAVQSPLLHYIRQYSPLLFRRTEQRYACPIRLQNATKLTRLLLGTGDL